MSDEVEEEIAEEVVTSETPSCFDCGRIYKSWQSVNIHSRKCSQAEPI